MQSALNGVVAKPRKAARKIAKMGRNGDTEIAHVTPGEVVLPPEFPKAAPGVMKSVDAALSSLGYTPGERVVASDASNRNPRTKAPEYWSAGASPGDADGPSAPGTGPSDAGPGASDFGGDYGAAEAGITGSQGGVPGADPGSAMGHDADGMSMSPFDTALTNAVRAMTRVGMMEGFEKAMAGVNQSLRDAGIGVVDGRGYSGPDGSPPAGDFGGGDQGNDPGGSYEPGDDNMPVDPGDDNIPVDPGPGNRDPLPTDHRLTVSRSALDGFLATPNINPGTGIMQFAAEPKRSTGYPVPPGEGTALTEPTDDPRSHLVGPGGVTYDVPTGSAAYDEIMARGAVQQGSQEASDPKFTHAGWYAPGAEGSVHAASKGYNNPLTNGQPFDVPTLAAAGMTQADYDATPYRSGSAATPATDVPDVTPGGDEPTQSGVGSSAIESFSALTPMRMPRFGTARNRAGPRYNPATGMQMFATRQNFDAAGYIRDNPDMQGKTPEEAWEHYDTVGRLEGRPGNDAERAARAEGFTGVFGANREGVSGPSYIEWKTAQAQQIGAIDPNTGQYRADLSSPKDQHGPSMRALQDRIDARQTGYAGDFGGGGFNRYVQAYFDHDADPMTPYVGRNMANTDRSGNDASRVRDLLRRAGYSGTWGEGGGMNFLTSGLQDRGQSPSGNVEQDALRLANAPRQRNPLSYLPSWLGGGDRDVGAPPRGTVGGIMQFAAEPKRSTGYPVPPGEGMPGAGPSRLRGGSADTRHRSAVLEIGPNRPAGGSADTRHRSAVLEIGPNRPAGGSADTEIDRFAQVKPEQRRAPVAAGNRSYSPSFVG